MMLLPKEGKAARFLFPKRDQTFKEAADGTTTLISWMGGCRPIEAGEIAGAIIGYGAAVESEHEEHRKSIRAAIDKAQENKAQGFAERISSEHKDAPLQRT